MTAAGVRNQRITIQQSDPVKGPIGDVTRSWSTYAQAWVELQTEGGNEFDRAAQVHAELTHVFRGRWIDGVTTDMQIVWRGRSMNILKVFDPYNRKDSLTIYCNEQLD